MANRHRRSYFTNGHLFARIAYTTVRTALATNNLTSLPSFVTTLSQMVDLNIGLWIYGCLGIRCTHFNITLVKFTELVYFVVAESNRTKKANKNNNNNSEHKHTCTPDIPE